MTYPRKQALVPVGRVTREDRQRRREDRVKPDGSRLGSAFEEKDAFHGRINSGTILLMAIIDEI